MLALIWLFFLIAAALEIKVKDNNIEVPFHLQLLESVAAIDEFSYGSAAFSIVSDEYDEEFAGNLKNDELVHQLIHNSAQLEAVNKSIADLRASSKFYNPRVQAHYQNYADTKSQMKDLCKKDMFGTTIDKKGKFAWLRSGDRIYCSVDDLFALEFSKRSDLLKELQPFDRVIGKNEKAPLLFLYGDKDYEGFSGMFTNLYHSASSGKLRFVWRYAPSTSKKAVLPNYAVSLSANDLEYSFTDEQVEKMGLKLASMILLLKESPQRKYQSLKHKMETFPEQADEISSTKVSPSVEEAVLANERMISTQEAIGVFLNGAPVNWLEFDAFSLVDKVNKEVEIIKSIMDLGFNLDQARTLLLKFALRAAVTLSEYNSGSDDNRYKVYKDQFVPGAQKQKGGVAFINDIESDENYLDFVESREEAYLGPLAKPGQLPPLKENIHDLIFVINLSSKEQLKVLFTYSKVILDNSLPQQVGILPMVNSELDTTLTRYFYFLYEKTSPTEALAFLYKLYSRESDEDIQEILESVQIKDYDISESVYERTIEKFGITEPSVVFNGIIRDLKLQWRPTMARQIASDIALIQEGLKDNSAGYSLKSFIYKNAKPQRDLEIYPKHSSGFKYKYVTPDLIRESTLFRKEPGVVLDDDVELWVIGDLSSEIALNQVIVVLELMKASIIDIQLRVLDLSDSGILSKVSSGVLTHGELESLIKHMKSLSKSLKRAKPNLEMMHFISKEGLPPHHSFLLVNSRYLRLSKTFDIQQLNSIIKFEKLFRLSIFDKFMPSYPEIFNGRSLAEFYDEKTGFSFHDWKELLVSRIMKSFHVDDDRYLDDVARFDFSSLNMQNSFVIDNKLEPLVDALVVIDPLMLYSQEILSLYEVIINLPFVRTRILLQPQSKYSHIPLRRLFKSVTPNYPLKFDSEGNLEENYNASFNELTNKHRYTIDIDAPKRWLVTPYSTLKDLDLDNISENDFNSQIDFELSNILVEGFATDVRTGLPSQGLVLGLSQGEKQILTEVMSNMGYFQFPANQGIWNITVDKNLQITYDLLSASVNPFDANVLPVTQVPVSVFTLDGVSLRPRLSKSNRKLPKSESQKQADINIFTVVSGQQYEKLASIMVASVRKHTNSSIKLWLLSNYLSPRFKQFLVKLSEKYDFSYELVSYKWPVWLRRQYLRQRTIWGYKILFLDVLFPIDLDQVIFIDADQINRSDMKELAEMDLGEAPYAFVPMCDSRKEMEGFRFWKSGYWKEVLEDEFKYHISALFKVNLSQFRQLDTGNRLRSHYQKLSSDPQSLDNLDQDLPNNMQATIPIYSLPEEYLWCETWCSDNTLDSAKNVDLCNNPLTKENKIEVAKRILPEWVEYEQEIDNLLMKTEFTPPVNEEEVEEAGNLEESEEEEYGEDDDFEYDEL